MTWESLKSTCFGKLGLSQDEFWASSLTDLSLRIGGFFELETEKQHAEYERQRLFTLLLLNIHIDKKRRIKSPIDLIEFPWEQTHKPPPKILNKKQKLDRFARMDKQMLEKFNNG